MFSEVEVTLSVSRVCEAWADVVGDSQTVHVGRPVRMMDGFLDSVALQGVGVGRLRLMRFPLPSFFHFLSSVMPRLLSFLSLHSVGRSTQ